MRGPFEHAKYVVPFRRLECAHYGECLSQAVDERWKSWHCQGCEVTEELTPDQKKEEMYGLLELLGAAHDYKDVTELWAPEPGDPKEDNDGVPAVRKRSRTRHQREV